MDARLIERIETVMEFAAAALLGGAVAYAAYALLSAGLPQPQLAACAEAAGVFAFVACARAMRMVAEQKPHLPVPVFRVSEIEPIESAEILLTEADRLQPDELVLTDADRLNAQVEEDPLVLDDILAEMGPDARVVRLFDRKAMPTPGQLKLRIDDHLSEGSPPAAPSDASQALSDALAELRRSLR
jgi:hypothetical protein